MLEKNPRTLENKLKEYARVMLPVLGLSLLYGSCFTVTPYQPERLDSYTYLSCCVNLRCGPDYKCIERGSNNNCTCSYNPPLHEQRLGGQGDHEK